MNAPRYEYSCATCGGQVAKPPVGKKMEGAKPVWIGLHGWRCSKDGSGIKVVRRLK